MDVFTKFPKVTDQIFLIEFWPQVFAGISKLIGLIKHSLPCLLHRWP